MGKEVYNEERDLEEEMRRLGFKKFTLKKHLKLRQKLFPRKYNKEEEQD